MVLESAENNIKYKSPSKEIKLNSSPKQHLLPMSGEVYLKSIESGVKKFEGRIHGPQVDKMKTGDFLRLFDNRAKWGILCKITTIDTYRSFEEMLRNKGILSLLPHLAEEAKVLTPEKLLQKGIGIYKGFPGSQRVTQCGVTAIGVSFINRIYSRR